MTTRSHRNSIVRTLDLNGCTRVERFGAGPPIVLLPSMLIRIASYRWLIERLRRGHTVYALEPPGCGAGAALDEPWPMEQYADWLIAAIDALELAPATVIGHSNSGPVATIAAVKSPRHFKRLILADPAGFAPRSLWHLAGGRFIDSVLELPFTITAGRDILFNAWRHWPTLMNQIRLAAELDLSALAPQLRVPTLVAWGRVDFTFRPAAARKLHALLPCSRLYVCASGSHDWLVQWAGEFSAMVDDFMNRT